MKNNDLKQLLKNEANKIEINDYSEDILLKINPNQPEKQVKPKRSLWLKPRYFIPSFVALALVVILFTFFAFNPGKPSPIPGPDIKPNYNMTSAKAIIGKEVLAGTAFIDQSSNRVNRSFRRAQMTNQQYLEEARTIDSYLDIALMMLNKDKIKIEVSENKDSSYASYQIKMVVKYLDDSNSDYVFYYNETATVEESDNDDMDEINSKIEGIIISAGNSYQVRGSKEVENEEYETDLIIELSANEYILVEQETEINENEFSYTFYENNKKIKEISQEFDLAKKEFSIEAKEYKDNKKLEYEMEFAFNSDGSVYTEYEKEIGDIEIELELKIYIYPTYNEYHFKNDEEEAIIKLDK